MTWLSIWNWIKAPHLLFELPAFLVLFGVAETILRRVNIRYAEMLEQFFRGCLRRVVLFNERYASGTKYLENSNKKMKFDEQAGRQNVEVPAHDKIEAIHSPVLPMAEPIVSDSKPQVKTSTVEEKLAMSASEIESIIDKCLIKACESKKQKRSIDRQRSESGSKRRSNLKPSDSWLSNEPENSKRKPSVGKQKKSK